MQIIKTQNYEELSKKAAEIIISEVQKNPFISICFATGETSIGIYRELIKAYEAGKVDFSEITTHNLDEYYPIKKTNKNSYYYFMLENLFNHINVKRKNINFLDGNSVNPRTNCENYEKDIKENPIDLLILGIGINGHIAFNEPGSSFDSKTRLVNLFQETIKSNSRFFNDINEVPKLGLTMGISTIMSAKKIIMLAAGANKKVAVKSMIDSQVNEDCPASFLQKHKDVVVIVDKDAGSLLE
jgi:glucosamine-6-phosphate deaminase